MRHVGLVALLVACVFIQGCLGSLIGALAAPQSVISGAATSLVNQGVSAFDGATQAASTVSDIDRIISDNPEGVNNTELAALRDELGKRAIPDRPANRGIAPPADEFDRRLPPPSQGDGSYRVAPGQRFRQIGYERRGNQLVVQREVVDDLAADVGRQEASPFATARTSSIPPSREGIYQYSWNPDPKPLDEHRGGE